jgi:hypothetical protein
MDDLHLLGYALLGEGVGSRRLGAFGDYATDIVTEGEAEDLPAPYAGAASRRPREPGHRGLLAGVGRAAHGVRDLPAVPLFSFVNAGPTTITQIARPQRPFLARRPVMDVRRSVATLLQLPVIANLQIGDRPQSIGEAGGFISVNVFSPQSFQTSLNLDRAEPGVAIGITINLIGAALAAGETIDVAVALIGHSVS